MSTFDAIVDASEGKGDYLLPSAAFADGKVNVFMRPGVYNETTNITIPDGGRLTGALRGSTIIDFGANAASIVCDSGYGSAEFKGAIEITSGSANVVGTDTTFTNLNAGDFISIHGHYHEIGNITDDTHLTLAHVYNGQSTSDLSYKALAMQSYNKLTCFTVRNSSTSGIILSGCRHAIVEDVTLQACAGPNMVWNDVAESAVRFCVTEFSGAGVGFTLNGVEACKFSMVTALGNYSHGLSTSGICLHLLWHDLESTSNGGCGAYINGTLRDANFTNCVMEQNYSHGLYANANAGNFTVNSSTFSFNGGSGIESHGHHGVFTNNIFESNNASAGLDITGDDCLIGKNIGYDNQDGTRVAGARCNVCDNSFTQSSENCCHIMSGAEDSIVTGNHFDFAGTSTLNDEGTNTLTNNSNKP